MLGEKPTTSPSADTLLYPREPLGDDPARLSRRLPRPLGERLQGPRQLLHAPQLAPEPIHIHCFLGREAREA
jgi:hypothetical protein